MNCELHSTTEGFGDYVGFWLVLGPDPYGPQGGTCGNVENGREVSGTQVVSYRRPDWLINCLNRISQLIREGVITENNYWNIVVEHESGTQKFEIYVGRRDGVQVAHDEGLNPLGIQEVKN